MKKKIVIKIVIAIILTVIIGFISSSLMPILGIDVALSQLENDDAYFIAMQSWHQIQNCLGVAAGLIWLVCIALIIKDVYNFIKNKKGENE